MVDRPTAKKIGYKQCFKAITVGLVIAYLIMALIAGPVWIFEFDYTPTIIFAVIVLYGCGFFFGSLAGIDILIQNRPSILFGILYGFVIVWTATFIGSLVGFFTEGLVERSPISEPFNDYILKPLLIITFYGFIPIMELVFGLGIR